MNVAGKYIRQARLRAKMTQAQLANALEAFDIHTDEKTIMRVEHGMEVVTDYDIKVLAQVLHVTTDELLGHPAFGR